MMEMMETIKKELEERLSLLDTKELREQYGVLGAEARQHECMLVLARIGQLQLADIGKRKAPNGLPADFKTVVDQMHSLELTVDMLNDMDDKTIIGYGETTNDPDGVYMTDYRKGDKMKWIAVCGYNRDWCVYLGWSEQSYEYILESGDKVTGDHNIRKLVKCTDEAFARYRK